jgi:peptide/nickel transport system substrate-binding protein
MPRVLMFAALAASLLMSACGGSSNGDAGQGAAATSQAPSGDAGAGSSTGTQAAPRGASRGELRIADNFILATTDSDVSGTAMMAYGVSEALMRITPKMTVEPWLAAKLEPGADPRTWVVTLRDDVTFHDGSPLDAEAVKTSIERSMQKQPGTASLIPPGTEFAAEGRTLTIRTPTPVALMPNSLAAFNFAIKKVLPDGKMVYTGPFMPTEFVERTSLTLTAYAGYRGGPARIKTIKVREVFDVAARVLALQSGDVDMAKALLPSDVARLKSGGFEVASFPFGRQNQIILNVTRPPLDDVAVRRAIALAIDRDALIKGVMDGIGTPAYGFAPDTIGIAGVLNTQKYDPAQARQVLDAAGWRPGPDGIRAKDGRRLAFNLGSYTQRAELEPLSVAIRDQLKAVGIDVSLEKFPDINSTVAQNNFDATMWSYNTVQYGGLDHPVRTMFTPSGTNKDRYNNPRVTDLFKEYIQTTDAARRAEQMRQMQTLIGEDVPVVYVLNPHQIVALSKKVKGYTPHPLEHYFFDADMSID